jgi:hypothetical protein
LHIEQALAGVPVDQRCACRRPPSLLNRVLAFFGVSR